ncbi:MAG TPA: ABC transporter permease subunit, partial [Polyangiaceae bacterium]|nr:ABC transporter permease subunit [Polyangiaceae bacterium]
MSKALLIARRELLAYVRSPLGAVIIAGALLLDGILFYWQALSQKLLSAEALARFFYNTSGVTMVAGLILATRLIAEERQTSTFTVLNTAPIRDWEIVVGKFISALGILALLTALTLYMPALLFVNGKVSLGHIAVGYLGLILLGGACVSIGLFASSLARSQVVAAIVGAAILT